MTKAQQILGAVAGIMCLGASLAGAADLELDFNRRWREELRPQAPTNYQLPSQPSTTRPASGTDAILAPAQKTAPQSNSSAGRPAADNVTPRRAPADTNVAKSSAPNEASVGYFVPLILIILALIGLFSVIGAVPRLLRAIDRWFEPAQRDAGLAEGDPFSGFFGMQTEMSADDCRREVDKMRAMKEHLDAHFEAAQAAIRDARAQHQHKEKAI